MKQLISISSIMFTVMLLLITFHEGIRSSILNNGKAQAAEERLKGMDRLYGLSVILCFAVGILVRCWQFGVLPMGLNQDGAMEGVEAWCLLRDGTDQYGTSWPTYFAAWKKMHMSPLLSWMTMPFFAVWGMNRVTLRLPMLIASIASLPVVWDFARRIAGKRFALAALFLVSTNPWHILQSRWALDCNILAHVLLLAMYLLYIGRENRLALYASMIVFAAAIYGYAVACFIIPVILVSAAIYYLARKKVSVADLAVCVVIFSVLSGPFFYTMAINAFGWETVRLGPVTLPYLSESIRTNDIAFASENPYPSMVTTFFSWIGTSFLNTADSAHNAMDWTHAMYLFMPAVYLYGIYRLWRDRRKAALQNGDERLRDGGMLLLVWLAGNAFAGIIIGGTISRENATFYVLIFFAAYILMEMDKRLRMASVSLALMVALSFSGLVYTYFIDGAYQAEMAKAFHYGLQEALLDTWDWDYDQYYISASPGGSETMMTSQVMFAHQIDYSMRSEETDLIARDGTHTDWYFTERYIFTDFSEDFEPDPMECAVYIMEQKEKGVFDPEEFLLWDYGAYAVAYPRYWAE